MSCAKDPSIEQMRIDLLHGGWTPSHGGTIWTALWGDSLYGPHAAWHKWAGEPMDPPPNICIESRILSVAEVRALYAEGDGGRMVLD